MKGLEFYKGKRVFLTGNTGFKGSWLSQILLEAGAVVKGYGLIPNTNPNLYEILDLNRSMETIYHDIRDMDVLEKELIKFRPDIVLHLAAQPIVRESYRIPRETFETNIMGTINLLEAVRKCDTVISFVNVTTDKVYENREWEWGYRECDVLNGYDPYSNSKSCSELVTDSYKKSFFQDKGVSISTARAGNVIGGGDFADFRILPDCVRAAQKGDTIILRNPNSIRPYQHVLEALSGYLMLAEKQAIDSELADSYNIGPDESCCVTTEMLTKIFCEKWGGKMTYRTEIIEKDICHEANFLKLDCSKIKKKIGWKQVWGIDQAVSQVVNWSKVWMQGGDIKKETIQQIVGFFEGR